MLWKIVYLNVQIKWRCETRKALCMRTLFLFTSVTRVKTRVWIKGPTVEHKLKKLGLQLLASGPKPENDRPYAWSVKALWSFDSLWSMDRLNYEMKLSPSVLLSRSRINVKFLCSSHGRFSIPKEGIKIGRHSSLTLDCIFQLNQGIMAKKNFFD